MPAAAAAVEARSSSQSLLDSLVNYETAGIPKAAGATPTGAFSLDRMLRLLAAMGDPHRQLQAVHVAGSKGKGSTVTLLGSILQASGLRTGVYTSPHLRTLEERIAVGGAHISADDLAHLVHANMPALERCRQQEGGALSHFEVLTALAYRYFADLKVDIAVVETGLGGITDATNVLGPQQLRAAVITSLGLEHVEALGGSLASIAAAKAGIMKRGRPVVIASQPHPEALQVLLEHAQRTECPVLRADELVNIHSAGLRLQPDEVGPYSYSLNQIAHEELEIEWRQASPSHASSGSITHGNGSSSRGSVGVTRLRARVGMVGQHQHSNIAAALTTVGVLRGQGQSIPDAAVTAGLAAAWLPARMQVLRLPPVMAPASGAARVVGSSQFMVLDGAHTAESATALADAVRALFPRPTPVALVLAMAADKEHQEVAAALRRLAPNVVVFTSVPIAGSSMRSASPGKLLSSWQAAAILARPGQRHFRCRELIQGSLATSIGRARSELAAVSSSGTGGAGVVVVSGSLHAAAEALRLMDIAVADA